MKKRLFLVALMGLLLAIPVGATYYDGNFQNILLKGFIDIPELSSAPGSPDTTAGRLYTYNDGLYFKDDAGSATNLLSSGTAWDDLTVPDAHESLDMTTYTTTWDFGGTADMFTLEFTGNFANVSGMKLEQKTGNPTDGTLLELVMADTDPDLLSATRSGTEVLNIDDDSVITVKPQGSPTNTIVLAPGAAATTGILITDTDYTNALSVGDNNIIGTTGAFDFTDFDVSADGAITLANDDGGTMITLSPSASITGIDASDADIGTALSVGANDIVGTTGLINYTNFDVAADGDVTCVDLTASGNVNITGTFQQDNITAATAATTLNVNGTGAGGVTIGGTSTGAITLGANGSGATLVNLPATVDLTISGGDFAVTDTANADMVTFTNNTMTTADILTLTAGGTRTSNNVLSIADSATTGDTIGITADSLTSGEVIKISADAQTSGNGLEYANTGAGLTGSAIELSVTDGAGFTGNYIRGYDGAAQDFAFKRYGELEIAGNAGSDMITITAGNFQMSDGDIDVDDGFVAVNSDEDHASNITRNYNGVGSNPVLSVVDDHTASTNVALTVQQDGNAATAVKIDQTGTGNAIGVDLNLAGDYPGIDIDASAARDGDVIDIALANMVDERALNVTGAWTGATGEGLIELNTTAGATIPAGQLVRLDQNGTGQHAAAIGGSVIYVADAATAPGAGTSYAILVDATNIEALHVDTGESLFDELTHHTGGIDVDAGVDMDTATNDIGVNVESTATGNTAGFGQVTIHGNHAGNDNDAALLRLVYQANGDAQDTFLLCEDESTGAAGNGTDQFKVGTNGDVTTSGDITLAGYLVNTPMTETVTTEANITDPLTSSIVLINGDNDADNDTIDLQDGEAAGQWVTLSAGTGVDADDTISINYGDTTCTNCAAATFDKQGENATYFWDGSSWVQTSLNTSL